MASSGKGRDWKVHVEKREHIKTQIEEMAIYKLSEVTFEEINPSDIMVLGLGAFRTVRL